MHPAAGDQGHPPDPFPGRSHALCPARGRAAGSALLAAASQRRARCGRPPWDRRRKRGLAGGDRQCPAGHRASLAAQPGASDHGILRAQIQDRLLSPQGGRSSGLITCLRCSVRGGRRAARRSSSSTSFEVAHRPPRPEGVRRRGRPAGAALAAGHPAGREGTPLPSDLEPGGLGRRDGPGRRVRPHDGAGRPDPGRRRPLTSRRTRARPGFADRQGRGVRGQSPPRRRDQPEPSATEQTFPSRKSPDRSARRLPRRGPARGDRARRLGRQRRRRREVQPGHLYYPCTR